VMKNIPFHLLRLGWMRCLLFLTGVWTVLTEKLGVRNNWILMKFNLNEILLGDNTFMAEIGDKKITYLNHSVLFLVGSQDQKFNEAMFRNLENLMKKSTLISGTGEKERKQFFNKLRKKVQSKIELLKGQD
jgi:hypothetical protein